MAVANCQGGHLPFGFGNTFTFIGSSDLGSPTLVPVTLYLSSDVKSLQAGRCSSAGVGSVNATLIIAKGGSLQYVLVYITRDGAAVGVVS